MPQAASMLAEPLPYIAGAADVQRKTGGIVETVDIVTRLGTLRREVQQRILRHGFASMSGGSRDRRALTRFARLPNFYPDYIRNTIKWGCSLYFTNEFGSQDWWARHPIPPNPPTR